MTINRALLWRLAALAIWMFSLECLAKAIRLGAGVELALRLHPIPDVIARTSASADHWAALGWLLQFVAAAVMAVGIDTQRVVRKVFIALGVLILADGLLLLPVALLVRS